MVERKSQRPSRRVVVIDEPRIEDYLLHEILELREPEKTHMIEEWLEAGNRDTRKGGTVLIGTPDGKPMTLRVYGEPFSVPPSGKRVNREFALYLLQRYGEHGRYYGRDQATGLMAGQENYFTEEEQKWASRNKFNYITNYLIQRPEKTDVPKQAEQRPSFMTVIEDVIPDEEDEEGDE